MFFDYLDYLICLVCPVSATTFGASTFTITNGLRLCEGRALKSVSPNIAQKLIEVQMFKLLPSAPLLPNRG